METFTVAAAARLVRFADVTKGARVLDVGCGTGILSMYVPEIIRILESLTDWCQLGLLLKLAQSM